MRIVMVAVLWYYLPGDAHKLITFTAYKSTGLSSSLFNLWVAYPIIHVFMDKQDLCIWVRGGRALNVAEWTYLKLRSL